MVNPSYVERGGELVFPPPFIAEGVQFFGFLVNAEEGALQRVCDRYLNEPGGVRDFHPAVRQVLVVFNRMDRMYAEQQPWRERGEFTEQEAAVWMLVWDKGRRKLCWFHPYMIVDGVHTLVTGREIYGFPKTLGTFTTQGGDPTAPTLLQVETAVVETFGKGAPSKHLPLITVAARRDQHGHALATGGAGFATIESLADQLISAVQPGAQVAADRAVPELVDTIRNVRIPDFLFLKQFRDGSRGRGAVTQSVDTAIVEMTRFHDARRLEASAYEVHLGDYASHDIRGELGLPKGPLPVSVAFWAKLDFRVGPSARLHGPPPARKQKVVILGGGVAAVTTAIRLTNDRNWRDRFESITLYQLGWRLGGKGAAGRGEHHTIEEHGLHVWLGFYENAFQTIRQIYASAGRTGECLSRVEHAFTKHDFVGVNELVDGAWVPWMFPFPRRAGEPGSGRETSSLRKDFGTILRWGSEQLLSALHNAESAARLTGAPVPFVPVAQSLARAATLVEDPTSDEEVLGRLGDVGGQITAYLDQHARDRELLGGDLLDRCVLDLGSIELRRYILLALMGTTVVEGLLRDRIFSHDDLGRLEGEDISRWLRRHRDRRYVWDPRCNPLVRGLYDFAFAYAGGDPDAPNFAAGPALRTVLRMCLTYKGAVFFKMNAGMGDTIFAPAYQALKNRGVDVRFFHKVEKLTVSADGRRVETIEIQVQATPKGGKYDPLIDVPCCGGASGSVPAWPNHPRYEQLEEGDALRAGDVDLESFWTEWPGVGKRTLRTGQDFDTVVLGVSVGALPSLCADLVKASPRWKAMTDAVRTVATQACQVWVKQTLPELGWTDPSPVIDAWIQPLNTWADMTVVRGFECCPDGAKPGSIAYFCGPLEADIPPQSDHGFPARMHREVEQTAETMLTRDVRTLWPRLGAGGLPRGDRVHQYVRANINPSDRYVLSLAGSARHRLAPDESGFDNLVLTGDWTRNGYNAGCVEAATWSGFQAANTILGRPLNDGVVT